MAQITESQLISSLKQLKEIKPRKEWAVLLKSTLLENKVPSRMTGAVPAQRVSFMDVISTIFTPRKLAYSFAVLLFLIVGIFGTIKLLPTEKIPQQPATLTNQTVAVTKDQINATVKSIAQNLKANPTQDPQAMKTLAKTLADIPGDIASNPDVKDLMQTVVEAEITDLQKTTLTDGQAIMLAQVEDLYGQGKYAEALELLMTNN